MSRQIVETAMIQAGRERVFAALSTPSELLQWWTDPSLCAAIAWDLDLRPGGAWRSRWRWTSDGTEFELWGEVVQVDAPRLLIVSWRDERYAEFPPTIVRYELESIGDATLVRVTHSGFDNHRPDYDDYNGGWSSVLSKLLRHLSARGESVLTSPGAAT